VNFLTALVLVAFTLSVEVALMSETPEFWPLGTGAGFFFQGKVQPLTKIATTSKIRLKRQIFFDIN
jgi:hypothetical protein